MTFRGHPRSLEITWFNKEHRFWNSQLYLCLASFPRWWDLLAAIGTLLLIWRSCWGDPVRNF